MTAAAPASMTLRRALEQSKNMVTARLLDGGVDKDPGAAWSWSASWPSRPRSTASA